MSTAIPIPLQEPVRKLLEEDVKERVSTSVLVQYSYFNDPVIQALQFLDVISMKDPATKTVFYKETLIRALPYIPKKLWFQHVWPSLQQEMRTAEVLASVLQPIIYLIQECSLEEYESVILPAFRTVFSAPTGMIWKDLASHFLQ
uniref:SCY1-like protein 2 n=1 Tax=Cacopsylla melanoneura TaxID=428564 RepID=A0A8D8WZU9_9HEMI